VTHTLTELTPVPTTTAASAQAPVLVPAEEKPFVSIPRRESVYCEDCDTVSVRTGAACGVCRSYAALPSHVCSRQRRPHKLLTNGDRDAECVCEVDFANLDAGGPAKAIGTQLT